MRLMTVGRPGRVVRKIILNGTGLLVFAVAVFPVFWMASTAFKPNTEIFSTTPKPLPPDPTLEHFDCVLNGGIAGVSFWDYFRNSALVAVVTVLVSSAARAAGGDRRGPLPVPVPHHLPDHAARGADGAAGGAGHPAVPDGPKPLDLLNSLGGLDRSSTSASPLPFAIWMLRGFVAAVPRELEEAACDRRRRAGSTIFWRSCFPLVAPGLVATSIFSFITAWNEFIFALTFLISDQDKYTLPIALQFFFGRSGNDWGPSWPRPR